jgi:hypothetical protein
MKISENTLNVLKNFSSINQSILIRKGNVVRTISPQSNILAKATIGENFEDEFALYELNRFLSVVSSLDDPNLEFEDDAVKISGGRSKTRYKFADQSLIKVAPDKDINLGEPDETFTLTQASYNKVLKLAGVLNLPNVAAVGNGETVSLVSFDIRNDGGDEFSESLGETSSTFKMIFNVENFRLMPGDYTVNLYADKNAAQFINEAKNVEYIIAVEAGSTFEK